MSIDQMRDELIAEYPGERWHRRVMAMPDMQVLAVYKSIRKRPKRKEPKKPAYQQLSFL